MYSVISDSRIKTKCQIFTPDQQVEKMLDLASYKKNLYGKKFLENSCGNGIILSHAILRYIKDCLKSGLTQNDIKKGLEADFTAFDVDIKRVEECKNRLDDVAAKYKITDVSWNIRCEDYLSAKNEMNYDFIVGNPPYIAYPDLPKEVQKELKKIFESCKKGKFDYSYAFIEKSYSELAERGSLVYIIPSNIFKNVFASKLRDIIKNDIFSIDDFPNEKIFENVLVSPAIIKIVKGCTVPKLIYRYLNSKKEIQKKELGDKWIFNSHNNIIGRRIGDYFKVSSSVATLLNEAFVLRSGTLKKDYYIA